MEKCNLYHTTAVDIYITVGSQTLCNCYNLMSFLLKMCLLLTYPYILVTNSKKLYIDVNGKLYLVKY